MSGTYNPDFYDLAIAGTFHGDIEWYCRKAREYGSPVLELGAGTGRITVPVAQEGLAVHALDAHPGMLDALRRKTSALSREVRESITITEGDMRRFRLDRTFSFVIIPFRAFLHNLTTDDQLACLQCVREHLVPGGRLAFNVFHPSLEYMAQHAGPLAGTWRWTASYPLTDGGQILRSEANRYDTVQRRVHSRHRYEHYDADGALTRTFLHHLELAYLYPQDLYRLLEKSGFEAVEITGDFNDRPFEKDTDELVVGAKRA